MHTHSSEHTHTHTHTHTVNPLPVQWAVFYAEAPGEQLGVRALLKGGESAGYSLQNQNGLKKGCIFTIVGWLCPHTAKTFCTVSPLKCKYYNLNSSDEGFRKSDSN